MLSEDAIDNLAQPIVDRQEKINTWIISLMARRIKKIGELKPSDAHKLIQLRNVGADVRLINRELAKLTERQVSEIKEVIRKVALDAYEDAKPFYDYREKPFVPFAENKILQRRVEAIAKQTAKTYRNLGKAQAFMVRDLKNPKILRPTSLSETYQSVVDEAIQAAQSGVVDYNTAMRRTLKQIVQSGLRRADYNTEKGRWYTQRMDTAVRRNLLDGVRAVNQNMQEIVGKQFGADGVEISVHLNPAPDHANIQGHQFTNAEYAKMAPVPTTKPDGSIDNSVYENNDARIVDVNGNEYPPIERKIGTLNCRHFAISIIIGYAKQNYTDAQLKEILRKNNKGYTPPKGKGKHMTMYQCTQHQRELETKVRYARDGQIAAREAGDMELAREYQAKINKYVSEYKQFSKACGLSEKPIKMAVSGYHKIGVKKE